MNLNSALVEDIISLDEVKADMAAVLSVLKDDFTRSLNIRTSPGGSGLVSESPQNTHAPVVLPTGAVLNVPVLEENIVSSFWKKKQMNKNVYYFSFLV